MINLIRLTVAINRVCAALCFILISQTTLSAQLYKSNDVTIHNNYPVVTFEIAGPEANAIASSFTRKPYKFYSKDNDFKISCANALCTIELRLASNDSFNSSIPFVEHDIPNKVCDRLMGAMKPDTYIADKNNFEIRISKEDCTIRYLKLDNYSNPKLDAVLNDLLLYKKDLMNKVNRFPGGINDVDWVQYKLKILVDIDQKARLLWFYPEQNKLGPIDKAYFKWKLQPITEDIDLEARSALKDLLNKYTWFSISKFGKQADKNGWLLVQHQDQDREFQAMVLERLQKLYPLGETDKTNYAYLYDRVSVAKHKLQRYGTQGYCTRSGQWLPWPSLDSQDFDVYRKEMGMRFTMSQYKKLVTDSACFAKKP